MKRLPAPILLFSIDSYTVKSTRFNKKKPAFKFTVEAAPEWTKLFERTQDGLALMAFFPFHLSGVDKNNNEGNDSTLLLFGDTYIGEVKDGKPVSDTMVNNTIAYIKGNDPDAQKSIFIIN